MSPIGTKSTKFCRRGNQRVQPLGVTYRGIDRKVVQVGPACRAGHGVIPDATRGLELQPGPVCLLLDRIAIKARIGQRESSCEGVND